MVRGKSARAPNVFAGRPSEALALLRDRSHGNDFFSATFSSDHPLPPLARAYYPQLLLVVGKGAIA
jgi:hypothetical protein